MNGCLDKTFVMVKTHAPTSHSCYGEVYTLLKSVLALVHDYDTLE